MYIYIHTKIAMDDFWEFLVWMPNLKGSWSWECWVNLSSFWRWIYWIYMHHTNISKSGLERVFLSKYNASWGKCQSCIFTDVQNVAQFSCMDCCIKQWDPKMSTTNASVIQIPSKWQVFGTSRWFCLVTLSHPVIQWDFWSIRSRVNRTLD